ncbi:hypothetical protein Tco_0698869 [Tanacetum coccineum]
MVITESSPIFTTVIPQSLPSFTPPPQQSTPTLPPTIEATNPSSILLNFASGFQFDNRVTTLEKEVDELKRNDPLNTQVTALVDEHLDSRLGATRDELHSEDLCVQGGGSQRHGCKGSRVITSARSRNQAWPHMSFPRRKVSTLPTTTPVIHSHGYLLGSLEHCDKDKDEDPFAGSDRGLKKRETNKDAEPIKGTKAKESQFGSSKGAKSQSKSSSKSIQLEEPEFKVTDSDMPQDQEENPGNDDEEPKGKVASKCDWFTKHKRTQEPADLDWNKGKTPQQGPTQSWLMTLASSADKPSKTFDELMSSPIDFSAYIMNGLKITNLTQETLLGPAFKLLKGTRSNYAELEYDFGECYKALLKKLDWKNPEGGDYLFDLTKPLPLVMNGNSQIVPVDYFFNNDLKYLQGGISTMTYTTSITKTKAAQYDLPGIEDMVPNI